MENNSQNEQTAASQNEQAAASQMKTKVYNLVILDKSGSMSSIRDAAIGGFNETIGGIRVAQDQFAETQEHYVSLLTFCGCSREYVYNCWPIVKVRTLTSRDYQPCCNTPLYDAMGFAINDLFKRVKDDPLATVSVTIITDGMENSSKEYSGRAIKALVEKMQEEYGWNFAYIGTNQDVEAVSRDLSIKNSMFFKDDDEGMRDAWERERKAKQRMYSRMDYESKESTRKGYSVEELACMMRKTVSRNRNYQEMSEFSKRFAPEHIESLEENQVFVFGSDISGAHSGGAARMAVEKFGAIVGQGEGLQSNSYAIPTTGVSQREMALAIERFIEFARNNPDKTFFVTLVGCGSAGHGIPLMARLFTQAIDVPNIHLPMAFWRMLL